MALAGLPLRGLVEGRRRAGARGLRGCGGLVAFALPAERFLGGGQRAEGDGGQRIAGVGLRWLRAGLDPKLSNALKCGIVSAEPFTPSTDCSKSSASADLLPVSEGVGSVPSSSSESPRTSSSSSLLALTRFCRFILWD